MHVKISLIGGHGVTARGNGSLQHAVQALSSFEQLDGRHCKHGMLHTSLTGLNDSSYLPQTSLLGAVTISFLFFLCLTCTPLNPQ